MIPQVPSCDLVSTRSGKTSLTTRSSSRQTVTIVERAYGIDLPRFDSREPTIPIILIVTQPAQRRANTSMDVGVIRQQPFLRSPVEVSAVVDRGLLAWCTTKDARLPGVEMRVEVDDADGAIRFVDAAEEGQGDGMVATEGDDAGKCLARLADARGVGSCGRRASEEYVVPIFDLLESIGIVVRRYRDVSAVNDFAPEVERVGCQWSERISNENPVTSRGHTHCIRR